MYELIVILDVNFFNAKNAVSGQSNKPLNFVELFEIFIKILSFFVRKYDIFEKKFFLIQAIFNRFFHYKFNLKKF